MASRDVIGPALPPQLADSDAASVDSGPGPALPPGFKENSENSDHEQKGVSAQTSRETDSDSEEDEGSSPVPRKRRRSQEEDDDGFFGPALPPGFKKQEESPERPIIGPALPPGFKKPSGDAEEKRGNKSQASDDEEEENVFGPMPASGSVESNPGAEIEDRARRMKEKLLGVDDESKQAKRDSWMVDLPPELKNFGFGPRTFKRRANDNSGDRSIWTDTPADREKKAKEQQEGKKPISKDKEEAFPSERDKRLAEQISSYNDSQRSESLLDLHRKKLKSKTDGEKNKPQERRPFDRDQDLQVHQIDEARKKALIKRSRDLNTRFSHGKCNTFL
ncbi:GPALPP motifs-containing protein 1 isoform X2 [Thamnophis elegans]|uniref:GPALPP motifs-containing protein 1 isoform X2 n=1 Tax=Thamnophis elegans TaxID=35005 RepID=UPI0013772517|nr:GPALPP motifs-containing protein 1 isoform X2 [Thamnophis elegans]